MTESPANGVGPVFADDREGLLDLDIVVRDQMGRRSCQLATDRPCHTVAIAPYASPLHTFHRAPQRRRCPPWLRCPIVRSMAGGPSGPER